LGIKGKMREAQELPEQLKKLEEKLKNI